ncbi:glucose/sorbosone dehydrogenase [Salinarchaeum sp. Harcht-Bsk1]|nr:glucose/sorbosone dehydrogenase [Salinarchaeum sp. Harcht-Bsk1]
MDESVTRRRALFLGGAAVGIAGCIGTDDGTESNDDGDGTGDGAPDGAGGGQDGSDDGTDAEVPLQNVPDSIALDTLVDGLQAPVGIEFSPDSERAYVLEQGGRILALDGSGSLLDSPVLDLREPIVAGGERGLLGLALHPEFASNRQAFVRYSAPSREGTPDGYDHTFVLASFEATEDGTSFRRESEQTILEIPEPQSNHNAGDLAFGPDGYLYVPVGDGGAGDDQGAGHVDDWYGEVAGGNGQDVTENLLGSLLRLDIDGGDPYAIPDDNPLVGEAGRDEHYAWGFRNPWRISFDAGGDGTDLYVADVGQSSYEEVNLVEAGGNYGWNVREGAHCFQTESCPSRTPDDVRGGEPLLDPVVEYPHSGGEVTGVSVIGGHVYRGAAIDGLGGVYVFGDFAPRGKLFASAPGEGGSTWPIRTIAIDGASVESLYAFGQDGEGECYALGSGANGGTVWRLGPAE